MGVSDSSERARLSASMRLTFAPEQKEGSRPVRTTARRCGGGFEAVQLLIDLPGHLVADGVASGRVVHGDDKDAVDLLGYL